MKRLFWAVLLLLSTMDLMCQELIFKSFEKLPRNLYAKINPRFDLNEDPCAFILVCVALEHPQITADQGIVGDVVMRRESEYGIYVPTGTHSIRINHIDFLPFKFEINEKLEPYCTYELYCIRPRTEREEARNRNLQLSKGDTIPEEVVRDREEVPYLMAETMPRFQGGTLTNFHSWVHRNLQYPEIAYENKISGRVVVSFIVERDGFVREVNVQQSPDRSLSNEVIRLIKESPQWEPGVDQGEPVRVKHTIPVTFRLIQESVTAKKSRYEVGDYYNDGQLEGIVFQVDSTGSHGKIVSLREDKLAWGTVNLYFGMESKTDGALNTNKFTNIVNSTKQNQRHESLGGNGVLVNIGNFGQYWPLLGWCLGKSQRWYIPAVEELVAIQREKSKINQTIEMVAREQEVPLEYIKNQYYWSSTEEDGSNAYLVLMSTGWAGSYFNKANLDYARCVATF